MNYWEQIKCALKLSHKTAKEVAAICGLSEASIYAAIKKKGAFISQQNLIKIANALGIPEFYFTNYSIDAPIAQFEIYSRVLSLSSPAKSNLKKYASLFDIPFDEFENDCYDTPNKFRPLTYSQIAFFSVMCECSWQFLYYGSNTPTPANPKLYVQMKKMIKETIESILVNILNCSPNEFEDYYKRYDSDFNNYSDVINNRIELNAENLTNEDLQMIMQFADLLRKKNMQIDL